MNDMLRECADVNHKPIDRPVDRVLAGNPHQTGQAFG